MHELAIVFAQGSAVGQHDAPVRFDPLHRDQFAIGQLAMVGAAAIGLELQTVASRHRHLLALAGGQLVQVLEANHRDAALALDNQVPLGFASYTDAFRG